MVSKGSFTEVDEIKKGALPLLCGRGDSNSHSPMATRP